MSNSLTLTRRNCGQYIEKNMELPQNCRSISAETFFNRPDILTDLIFVLWYFPMKWNRLETKPFRDVPG